VATSDESAERLARVRESLEVWNREGLEVMAERHWHPDMVWEEPEGFPDAAIRRGRSACVSRMRERLDLLGHVRLEPSDARVVGDVVFVEVLVRGRGASSGAPVELREFFVLESDRGLTTRFREFLDRDAALAAAKAAT
jgi:ketosteroid isomerase-like protein